MPIGSSLRYQQPQLCLTRAIVNSTALGREEEGRGEQESASAQAEMGSRRDEESKRGKGSRGSEGVMGSESTGAAKARMMRKARAKGKISALDPIVFKMLSANLNMRVPSTHPTAVDNQIPCRKE